MRLTNDEEAQGAELLERATKVTPEQTAFAPGVAAQHPFGILYQGEWETPWDGTCTAVRLHARALAATGVPVLLRSFSGKVITREGTIEPVALVGVPPSVKREVGELPEASIATLVPLIKHVVARDAEHLGRLVMPRHVVDADPERMMAMRAAIYRATIVYSVWERHTISAEMAQILSRVHNWVPCEQNRDVLMRSGVPEDRVEVVPHPYEPDDVLCGLTRRAPGQRPPRFYSIGRWEPRKAYAELIAAFLQAFKPGTDARLTIKYSGGKWDGYPSPEQALESAVRESEWQSVEQARGVVQLIEGRLPRADILRLHFENNIYVCSSHGEAWCLPAFEAKNAGNAMVHVPYGGTADFAGPTDVSVPFTLGPADASYRWEAGAQWATYEREALVRALRAARAPTVFERPEDFEERFGLTAVGQRMLRLALSVAHRMDAAAAEYLAAQRS